MSHETLPAESQPTLADPDHRPAADVVIFDGHCPFCRRQVARLAAWDGRGRLAFLSLHDPRVSQRYPDLKHDQLMEQMYVVDSHGTRRGGAAAVRYLTRRLPSLWWLAPLLHIPLSLAVWQWCYRQVAKRRYQLACDDDQCKIHWGK